jgi:hypothetical protein
MIEIKFIQCPDWLANSALHLFYFNLGAIFAFTMVKLTGRRKKN